MGRISRDVLRETEFWGTPVKSVVHRGIDDVVVGAGIVDEWWDEMRRGGEHGLRPLAKEPVVSQVNLILSQNGYDHGELSAWWVEVRDCLQGRAPRELLGTLDEEFLISLAKEDTRIQEQ